MTLLEIVTAPNPVFRTKAAKIELFNAELEKFTSDMLETMYERRGLGIAAAMVGEARAAIVVDIQPEGKREPLIAINPEIVWLSDKTVTNEEASLSFPGISADITRPEAITLRFQDVKGVWHEIEADGWLATVIQHEMDYLDGRTYLDHLSKMKRDRLMKKMQKYLKNQHSHACGDPHCGHDHH